MRHDDGKGRSLKTSRRDCIDPCRHTRREGAAAVVARARRRSTEAERQPNRGCADRRRSVLRILSNSRRAPRRTARRGLGWGIFWAPWLGAGRSKTRSWRWWIGGRRWRRRVQGAWGCSWAPAMEEACSSQTWGRSQRELAASSSKGNGGLSGGDCWRARGREVSSAMGMAACCLAARGRSRGHRAIAGRGEEREIAGAPWTGTPWAAGEIRAPSMGRRRSSHPWSGRAGRP